MSEPESGNQSAADQPENSGPEGPGETERHSKPSFRRKLGSMVIAGIILAGVDLTGVSVRDFLKWALENLL
ncbi:hypothetical protein [Streptomyces pristinaespiralis]|uniref:hypothetical protein n=1 Tax=Streptomyces pristinaespiralis TaxID=38300 RepID=UPI0033C2A71C